MEPLADSCADGAGTWEADQAAGEDFDLRSSLLSELVKPNKESNSLNIPFTVNHFQYTDQYGQKGPLGGTPTVRAQKWHRSDPLFLRTGES
jgi:hypothetical protein